MGGDSVAADIRAAREDSSIKAIVLRVDSGGGSVVGSEVIRREVELADHVKPVVVSMSDVAASGGYWIATPARKIVADPDTITGSIGVLIGKIQYFGALRFAGDEHGLRGDQRQCHAFFRSAEFHAGAARLHREIAGRDLCGIHQGRRAQGRKMSVEAVDKIGKGRVWSGAQAKELGLVDELGGLDRAIEVAKQLSHIPAGESRAHRALSRREDHSSSSFSSAKKTTT